VKDKKVHLIRERESSSELFLKEKPAPISFSLLEGTKKPEDLKEETPSVTDE